MSTLSFTTWARWTHRTQLTNLDWPGVYVLAVSDRNLTGEPFSWRKEIVYVGMTNAKAGLQGRLRQLDDTIAGKRVLHGGADRIRFKYRNYPRLISGLYVSIRSIVCDVESNRPRDLICMGNVAALEFECLAAYARRFGRLPEFNDKKEAHKYSRTVGRAGRR